jgi:hypothetical protein
VEGFFDILYLGIFTILSPAFDSRFYLDTKPPTALVEEVAHAIRCFYSLLNIFTLRFFVILDGVAVSHSYVVDRMLAEFAAAAVVFAKAAQEGMDDAEIGDEISCSKFIKNIEGILQASCPNATHYYSRCLERSHRHFVWTGPRVQILPRSEVFIPIISHTARGERKDLPGCEIYVVDLDPTPPTPPIAVGKRRVRGDSLDLVVDQPKKRKV